MTTELFHQLQLAASDFDTAIRDYFDAHQQLNFDDDDLTRAIDAAVKMMHGIRKINTPKQSDKDTFVEPFNTPFAKSAFNS